MVKALKALFAGDGSSPTSPPPPPPPPPGAPDAPTDLAFSSRTDTTWTGTYTDNSSDEDGFRIYADSTQSGSVGANVTTITASSLTEGTQYDFVVRAFNSSGESPDSNTVTSYTQLAAPSNMQAFLSGGVVTFSWTNNSSNYTEVAVYKDGSEEAVVSKGTTQYQEDESTADGTWKVRAQAASIPAFDFSNSVTGPPFPE